MMKRTHLIRTLTLGSVLAIGVTAQTAEPYHGQTDVPNKAAANDQPNTALSGNTPRTNSTMQQTRDGNMGFDLGWLGLLGLGGLLGLRRGSSTESHEDIHHHTPEMHRG
jgi:MYXO-CTERM domain-containing protein